MHFEATETHVEGEPYTRGNLSEQAAYGMAATGWSSGGGELCLEEANRGDSEKHGGAGALGEWVGHGGCWG